MSAARLSRREFVRRSVVTSVGFASLGAFGGLGCKSSLPKLTDRQRAVAPVAEQYFAGGSLAGPQRIGNQHLQQHRPSRMQLDALLEPTVALIEEAEGDAEALAALDAALDADFAELRIVDVRGWTLGRTEVGLCILVARRS